MADHLTLFKKGLIVISLPLLVQLFFAWRVTRTQGEVQEARVRSAHTQEVLRSTQDLMQSLEDTDTNMRGFLLTGHNTFVEPYWKATREVGLNLEGLQGLVANDPGLEARARDILSRARKFLAWQEENERLVKTGQRLQALERLKTGEGKRSLDSLRLAVARFRQQEEHRDRELGDTLRDSLKRQQGLVVAGSLAAFVITASLAFILHRGVTNRMAALAEDVLRRTEGTARLTPTVTGDEITRLGHVFRDMADHLTQAEDRFRAAFLEAPFPMMLHAEDGEVLQINQAWVEQTGYTHEELPTTVSWVERSFPDRGPAEPPDTRLTHSANGQCPEGEHVIATASGEERTWVLSSARLDCPLPDGRAVVLTMAADVTERKQAEAALRRASEEVRDLYNNAPCGYHSLGPDGTIVAINDTELRWLGYERDEVINKLTFPDLLTPQGCRNFQQHFPRFKERGAISGLEFELVRKDGSRLPVLLNATAIRDADGRYVASRSTLFDLSERRQAEQTIRLYADVVEHVPLGLAIWHLDDLDDPASLRLVTANPAASELLGVDLGTCLGHTMPQAFPAVPEADLRGYAGVVRSGRVWNREELHYGDERVSPNHFSVKAFPLPGQCVGIAFENITARKQAEDEIRQFNTELEERVWQRTVELEAANRDLAEKNRENEMFVYSVSHDLRSPLVNLEGFNQELGLSCQDLRALLADPDLPPAVRDSGLALLDGDIAESRSYIQTSVQRLANIIDALLRLSRAGRVEYRLQVVDMGGLVRSLIDSLQGTIVERGAVVTVGELPPAWADPTAVEQTFSNLIGNALKYGDPQRPSHIEIGCIDARGEAGADGFHTYFVKDNGLGIPEPYQHKVFQVFQRIHTDVAEGDGMGLAIVRRVVERHGGKVRVESAPGEGSTFYVTLPSGPVLGKSSATPGPPSARAGLPTGIDR